MTRGIPVKASLAVAQALFPIIICEAARFGASQQGRLIGAFYKNF
jgi:hypothetical protein